MYNTGLTQVTRNVDRVVQSIDLRILAVMVFCAAVFGVVDGSLWRTLLTPTIAYRPAILFALTLVFGWRGFVWSQLVFLASFTFFLGWRGAVFITPMYLLSHAGALFVARKIARGQPWVSRERSTLAFLAGAILAPALPALLNSWVLRVVGVPLRPGGPASLDSWLRGTAAILSLVPAVLVYCSEPLKAWAGLQPRGERQPISKRNWIELGVESLVWSATFWMAVEFKPLFGLNITYLTFLPLLVLTLFRGLPLATLALAANAIIATTLWLQLHWVHSFPAVDLRLLIAIYSTTILVLAAVADERQRSRVQIASLIAAEAALRSSEERLHLATKATNDAIWDLDLKAGTVSWNDTYFRLYGRPDRADSWQFWIDHIHPEDRTRTVEGLQAAIAGGASSWSAEYRFRRLDGEWAHIYDRGYIAHDASGNASRVIGAMQDLTEKTKSEAALRESEERFRRVFEEGPLGLALVGRDYRFEKANSALCRMVDYDEVELLRLSFVDITHPDDVGVDIDLAEQLFKREIPFYHIQKRYVKKSGEIIWINLTASVILGPNDEPLHGLAMVEDITEIKRTQEEALVRQKLESVGTLAGGIAHDFNNLLGAIQAQTELAMTEMDAGASCREELKVISDVAMRGSEIVRQLMIYAGKENEVAGPVDLSKTVDEMISLLKVSVTKRALIQADLQHDLPAIHASAGQIGRVVMNLITNASDAIGDREGKIRVISRCVTLIGYSAAIALPDGDYVQLEVTDTGSGMSPQTRAKVFDPFFTTKSAGRGLGLAVVQGIVRSLDGAIQLTSEPDQGTTFQVFLPCAKTTANASGHAMAAVNGRDAVPRQHGTVLVVEDEGNLRQPIVKMLRNSGFAVLEAADGTSAIDLLRAKGAGIDVILLDMTIPGASSREVVEVAANVRPNIKVILTSAYSQEMIRGSMRAPQIRSFIRKPFQIGELLNLLRSSLSS
jgi:PAS domain S-box-containing protein